MSYRVTLVPLNCLTVPVLYDIAFFTANLNTQHCFSFLTLFDLFYVSVGRNRVFNNLFGLAKEQKQFLDETRRIVQFVLRRSLRLRHRHHNCNSHEQTANSTGMSLHSKDSQLHLLLGSNR